MTSSIIIVAATFLLWILQIKSTSIVYEACTMNDQVVDSDLWLEVPKIMSAGFGFEGILGCANILTRDSVKNCQGSWYDNLTCTVCADGTTGGTGRGCEIGNEPPNPPPIRTLTSASTNSSSVPFGIDFNLYSGLPICFSWPVLMSSAKYGNDFNFTITEILPNGKTRESYLISNTASAIPNFEFNEKHCVVVAGKWGNRLPSSKIGAIWPTYLRIIEDSSPLMLIGPNGPVSAIGLSIDLTKSNPYNQNGGPYLLAAKVSKMNINGEGGLFCPTCLPNDGVSLYGLNQAKYRLRMFYSGGFSPNGVMKPIDFAKHFRLVAKHKNGKKIALSKTNTVYYLPEKLIIHGLADVGRKQEKYDDCYVDDVDNYIDIILSGSQKAVRRLILLQIPGKRKIRNHQYYPLYNPGGPGKTPFPGVTYTSPGPTNQIKIQIALDDPKVVSYSASIPAFCNLIA